MIVKKWLAHSILCALYVRRHVHTRSQYAVEKKETVPR